VEDVSRQDTIKILDVRAQTRQDTLRRIGGIPTSANDDGKLAELDELLERTATAQQH